MSGFVSAQNIQRGNGPDAGASHIRNTGNQNVIIAIITRTFLVSEAMSGLSEEVGRGVKIHRLKVIRQHEWVTLSRLDLSEMMK